VLARGELMLDEIGLGDHADRPAAIIDHRHAADPAAHHQIEQRADLEILARAHHIAGHDPAHRDQVGDRRDLQQPLPIGLADRHAHGLAAMAEHVLGRRRIRRGLRGSLQRKERASLAPPPAAVGPSRSTHDARRSRRHVRTSCAFSRDYDAICR
jgi:hypothetical protein